MPARDGQPRRSEAEAGLLRFLPAAVMRHPRRELAVKLLNLGFRLASMTGKFGLSVFIARYLDLSGLGTYGIVFGISMFMVVFLGGRIDHDLGRRIVLVPDDVAGRLLRDQSLFYALNSAAALPFFLIAGGLGLQGFDPVIALCTWAICCFEAYANLLFVNSNALGKSLAANAVFFVRSGLWAFVAMAALVLFPALRTLSTVLVLWIVGSGTSIWLNLRLLGYRRWPGLREVRIGWSDLRRGLVTSFPIWLGSIGLAGGTYLDRVVLGAYLDLKAVGIATFYASFSVAVVALVSSSGFAVALPKLVKLVDRGDRPGFARELRGLAWYSGVLGLAMCLLVGIAVPLLSGVMHKPEIDRYRDTLWVLLAAALLRLLAESVFAGLYALRRDVSIWLGNLVFLLLSLVANICLIGKFGLIGLGLANLLASLFLLLFRWRGLSARLVDASPVT